MGKYRSTFSETDLDTVSFPGNRHLPSIVFIHGLGMDMNIWVSPAQARVLGGLFPLEIMVGSYASGTPRVLQTLFHDLKGRGHPVITWSQRGASEMISAVVPELAAIAGMAQKMSDAGIILVGHSRGGLIARKYLLKTDNMVKGLITISTPHRGSALAKIGQYMAPLASLLSPLVNKDSKNTIPRALKRISEFLASEALQELLPASPFFQTLGDSPLPGVSYVSAGGTKPMLFSRSPFSFPGLFEKIIPEQLFPDEMKVGKGDGLVSAESSKMPCANEHFYFACNHAEILFDQDARDTLVRALDRCVFSQ